MFIRLDTWHGMALAFGIANAYGLDSRWDMMHNGIVGVFQ